MSTFIWERMLQGRGSQKLNYPAIVAASIAIADRDGLEAVSMRSVAKALDAGAMSLYRYVEGKDDLLDLILDAAYGEIPLSNGRDWREVLRKVANESRRVLAAHPWLAPLVTRRPTLGPNYLAWFEHLLAATAGPGRSMKARVRMIGTVWAYVSGFVAYELGERETARRHGLTEAKKKRLAKPYVTTVLASGKFVNLAEFLKTESGTPTDDDFREGLEAVLEGIARRVA